MTSIMEASEERGDSSDILEMLWEGQDCRCHTTGYYTALLAFTHYTLLECEEIFNTIQYKGCVGCSGEEWKSEG
jgi:hypothetical protein